MILGQSQPVITICNDITKFMLIVSSISTAIAPNYDITNILSNATKRVGNCDNWTSNFPAVILRICLLLSNFQTIKKHCMQFYWANLHNKWWFIHFLHSKINFLIRYQSIFWLIFDSEFFGIFELPFLSILEWNSVYVLIQIVEECTFCCVWRCWENSCIRCREQYHK